MFHYRLCGLILWVVIDEERCVALLGLILFLFTTPSSRPGLLSFSPFGASAPVFVTT